MATFPDARLDEGLIAAPQTLAISDIKAEAMMSLAGISLGHAPQLIPIPKREFRNHILVGRVARTRPLMLIELPTLESRRLIVLRLRSTQGRD